MNGKRQNQYARTVIVCDPYIDIDECLLPHCIANVLSKTIRVTDNNVKELTRLMLDRKLIYVINTEGEMIRMKGADPLTYTLKPGKKAVHLVRALQCIQPSGIENRIRHRASTHGRRCDCRQSTTHFAQDVYDGLSCSNQ